MKNITLGLISSDPSFCELITEQVKKENIVILTYASAQKIPRSSSTLFNGFIIDFKSTVGASTEDKELIQELQEYFPYVRINKTAQGVNIFLPGESKSGTEVLDFFINDRCTKFIPKGIRSEARTSIYLNISWRVKGTQSWIRSNTLNASKAGMFIMTIYSLPKNESEVELEIFNEAQKTKTSKSAVVKWSVAWGTSSKHPAGFGVEFT